MPRFTASLHVPIWLEVPEGTDPAEMIAALIAHAAESNAAGILPARYGVVDGLNGERLHVSFGEEGYGGATIHDIGGDQVWDQLHDRLDTLKVQREAQ